MVLYELCRPLVWTFYHLFFKLDVRGLENVPENDGAIICPNHRTNHDPVIIALTLKRPVRYMAKAELFQNKFAAFFLKTFGAFPIKRGEADLTAVKNTLRLLKDKQLLGIFPEGTRVKTGDFGKAQPGVAVFSLKTGKPVIPVYIQGSFRLFSKIKIVYGEPLYFDKYKKNKDKMTNDDYYELSQIIIDRLRELREGSI